MDPFEIKEVLKSMVVLHDTREQQTDRARRRYESFGLPHRAATLDYGDYTYNATLPNKLNIYNEFSTICPQCVIERKMDLAELSQCVIQHKDRFEREFQRAQASNAKIFLIVENGSWEHIIAHKYRTKVHPNAFMAALTALMIRYDLNVIFCKEESSGRIIREILHRDLKERLERGEFDVY